MPAGTFFVSAGDEEIADGGRILETVRMMIATLFQDVEELLSALGVDVEQVIAVLHVGHVPVGVARHHRHGDVETGLDDEFVAAGVGPRGCRGR